jgi:hypothetical protein
MVPFRFREEQYRILDEESHRAPSPWTQARTPAPTSLLSTSAVEAALSLCVFDLACLLISSQSLLLNLSRIQTRYMALSQTKPDAH